MYAVEEKLIAGIADVLESAILVLDLNGDIIYSNRSAKSLLEFDEAELSKINIDELIRPYDGNVRNFLRRLFEEDENTGELKSKIVKKVILDLEGNRGKVAILYGDWTIGAGEAFELDPDTTTISPATDDTSVLSSHPDSNYGSANALYLRDHQDYTYRVFVRFDLSSIPSGATINLAKVRLYYYQYMVSDPAGKQVDIHRVLGSWDESTLTWNNKPDIASTATSSINMPSSYGWVEWDVTDDVQDMVDGTVDNYGWCVKYHDESLTSEDSSTWFRSKEYDGYDSELYVEYTSGQDIKKVINETESVSEGKLEFRSLFRLLSETVSLQEGKLNFRGLVRRIVETLSVQEVASRIMSVVRAIGESVSVSEAKLRLRSLARCVAESVNISEGISKVMSYVKMVGETVSLSELVNFARNVVRVIGENVNLAEMRLRILSLCRAVAETIGIDEMKMRFRALAGSVSEVISVSEAKDRFFRLARMVGETVSISEEVLKYVFYAIVKVIGETVSVLEDKLKSLSLSRIVPEYVSVIEDKMRLRSLVRFVAEEISLAEAKLRSLSLVRIVGETINIEEIYERVRSLVRLVVETVAVSEVVYAFKKIIMVVAETVGIVENVVKSLALKIVKVVSETVSLVESFDFINWARRFLRGAISILKVGKSINILKRKGEVEVEE